MGEAADWPRALLVAFVILVPEGLSLSSALLQRSRIGSTLPPELEGIFGEEEYRISSSYSKAKSDCTVLRGTLDLVVFFAFWFLGGFPWLDGVCVGLGLRSDLLTGVVFVGALGLAHMILGMPWGVYGTFVVEERFGFNKTTPRTFAKDVIKSTALCVALGGPFTYIVMWFFTAMGSKAWFYVFVVTAALQLAAAYVAPTLLLPLFLEMIPLPRGTALITSEGGSNSAVPKFLSGRAFYESDLGFHGKPCWQTSDRRFAGAGAGATLSIWWSETARSEGGIVCSGAGWVLAEGEPGGGGPIYASCAALILERQEDGENPKTLWLLTAEAAAAGDHGGTAGSAESGGLQGPLVQERTSCAGILSSTCVDLGSLHRSITALAERLGYRGASICIVDGSSRSGHSNAFCAGFGRFRRICLFDTMLPLMTEGEILAVLGHEIGHDRLGHVHMRLAIGLLELLVMFWALGAFLNSAAISSAFFVVQPKVYVSIVLFAIVWSVVEFATSVPSAVLSRANEFSADRFSVEADASYGPWLSSALKKLTRKSKVNLTPHPFTVFLTYSHPTLDARLRAIREHQSLLHGGGRECRELRSWPTTQQDPAVT